jgi:presequence protease
LNLANNDWDALQLTLLQMNDKLKNVSRTGMTISVSGDRTALKDMAPACRVFVRDLLPEVRGIPNLQDFATSKHPWVTPGTNRMKNSMKTEDVDEAFVIPTRVSHVGKGGQIYEEGERINGYDLVTLKYLGGFFLFYQLKYTQGAKEAQANLDLDSGVLIYQSDRDPSIIETLDVYEHAAEFIMSGVATYNKLPVDAAAAIVGTVGWMDGPALQPNSVGYTALVQYLKQETSEVRQIWRDEILSTKRQDFLDMAERLGAWGKNSISVVTSEEQLEKATLRGLNATVCNFQGYVC